MIKPNDIMKSQDTKPTMVKPNKQDKEQPERSKLTSLLDTDKIQELVLNDTSEMFAYYDLDLKIIWANQASAKSVGKSLEDIQGSYCYQIWNNRNEPCENCIVLKALDTKTPQQGEQITSDGRRWILRGYPVIDENGEVEGLIELGQNITAFKQAEERFSTFITHSPTAVFTINEKGDYTFVNPSAARLLGYSSQELLTMNIAQIVHPDSFQEDMQTFPALIEGKHVCQDISLMHKTGEKIYALLDAIMLDKQTIIGFCTDVTERKKAEQALKESEDTYRNLFQNAQVGLFRTRIEDGKILESNEQLAKMFGFSNREEFIENYYTSENYVDQGTRELMVARIKAQGKIESFEARFYRKDRSIFWARYSARIYPEKGWIEGVAEDITEKKKVDEHLKHLFESAKSILEYDDFEKIARIIFDKCKQITGADSGYVALLSESGEENEVLFLDSGGLPCSVDETLPMPVRGFRGEAYRFQKAVFHNDFANSDYYQFIPEGHVILRNVMFAPLIINKSPVGLIGLANKPNDFTEEDLQIITAFGELASIAMMNARNYKELKNAKNKAEESDKLKSAFLANMSHEIRTPMNGILGFLELMQDPDLSSEDMKKYIHVVKSSGDRLLNTINDIIEISKIEAGQISLNTSTFHLSDLLIYHYNFFVPEAHKKGLELKLNNGLTSQNDLIQTDRTKLESILSNLIKNAIKFTHSGYVEIKCQLENKNLIFWVSDSGTGIAEDKLKVIFQRFVQADTSHTRPYEGSGLGLSIARAYVDFLHGEISVESEVGKGSRFQVSIPCPPITEGTGRLEMMGPAVSGNTSGNKLVLIAEDDDSSYELLKILLERLDYKIIRSIDGEETVKIVNENPDISVILMDLKMPVMDGYKATQKIREFNKNVCIIGQSAYALHGDREKALNAGCNDYLTKPIKKEDLMAVIHMI